MLLRLGNPVRCTDGPVGELADLVMLPAVHRVTHVVVVPQYHESRARLVPIDLLRESAHGAGVIELQCTIAQLGELPTIQSFANLRLADAPRSTTRGGWGVGIQRAVTLPSSIPGSLEMDARDDEAHVSVRYDRIPKGEVEVQRRSAVTGSDGAWIGYLDGLTVDDAGGIVEVLVEHGHIRCERPLAVPSGAVTELAMDGVTLALSRSEVDALVPATQGQRSL
jgi:hypothetical protein